MAVINGNDLDNTLNGTDLDDQINGFGGNDTINARQRPSAPGSGVDVVDGGDGIDTLIVNAASETGSVSLSTGFSPAYQVRSESGNFYVDAYSVERVRFTGGAGNDFIDTGDRGGSVAGGGGIDHWLANLGGLFTGVNFTLGSTTAIAAADISSITSIERITLTTGAGNDTITGGAQADTINTGDGDDTIDARTRPAGGGAVDVVDGGADTDTLIVNAAAETQSIQLSVGNSPSFSVRSTSGNFYVDAYRIELIKVTGGSGDDVLDTWDRAVTVNGGAGIDHWLANFDALTDDIAFRLGTTTRINPAGLTSILGIERISMTTGSGDDTITGGAQADTINTGDGNDLIDAQTRPAGGGPVDVVDGGNGNDTLIVDAGDETQAVQLSVGNSPNFSVRSDSGNFYLDAYGVEKVRFTGGSGADTINTADRAITVDGGAGIDLWRSDFGALSADITFINGTTTRITPAGLTAIQRIERIAMTTGAGDDTVTGGAQADDIRTGAGNDRIDARTRPVGDGAVDLVDGGSGNDTLVVDASGESRAVQLSIGNSPSFSVRSDSGRLYLDAYGIEKISFTGGAGADRIETGDRAIVVDGGGGIDHWIADLHQLNANLNFVLGTTSAIAPAGITTLAGIERITLSSGNGNDTLVGGNQADQINGGRGNDRIDVMTRPVNGNDIDYADGGAGNDTLVVDASGEVQAVQVFAGNWPAFSVRSGSERFYTDAYNMEALAFTGGAGGDFASGRGGADSIVGNNGNDTLYGMDGADTLVGGIGLDLLYGGRAADRLTGGAGNDTYDYDLVTDSAVALGTVDTITDFGGGDRIDLSDIDADNLGGINNVFTFIGADAFHGVRGELRSTGGMIEGDVNGDGIADLRILLGNGAVVGLDGLVL